MSVVIVTGSPGTGKTTLCRALAAAEPQGLHLVSDVFYDFIAHRVDPSKPESQHQNTVVMQALAQAVRTFADGGYTVFLDGIFGPWFLPVLRPLLEPAAPTHYVVLQVPVTEAHARVRERQGSGLSPTVAQMHRQFSELGPLSKHRLDVGGASEAEAFAQASRAIASGAVALDWSLVA